MLFRFFLLALTLAAATAAPVVNTPNGDVQGIVDSDSGSALFRGIPYAEAPIGTRRFAPPAAKEPWGNATLDATKAGPACFQFQTDLAKNASLPQSEDCLTVDVAMPPGASPSASLPVMVWIHGGSFQTGYSSYDVFDIAGLAKATGAVVCAIQYRLGALGFLSLYGTHPNVGLLDQTLALHWVQDNIPSFGGDPGNVTIFGESAGGMSVALHLLLTDSWGTFRRAIAESPGEWTLRPLSEAEAASQSFASKLGCPSSLGRPGQLQCLQRLSADVLASTAVDNSTKASTIPCVDGTVLERHPLAMFASGDYFREATVMVGTNHDEGESLVIGIAHGIPASFTEAMFASVVEDISHDALTPYIENGTAVLLSMYSPVAASEGYFAASGRVLGDVAITCGANSMSKSISKHSLSVGMYRYMFAARTPEYGPPLVMDYMNATHFCEVPYVFNAPRQVFNFTASNASFTWSAEEAQLSSNIQAAWGNLARVGHPTPSASGDAMWKHYDPEDGVDEVVVLDFDSPDGPLGSGALRVVSEWQNDFCDFWVSHLVAGMN